MCKARVLFVYISGPIRCKRVWRHVTCDNNCACHYSLVMDTFLMVAGCDFCELLSGITFDLVGLETIWGQILNEETIISSANTVFFRNSHIKKSICSTYIIIWVQYPTWYRVWIWNVNIYAKNKRQYLRCNTEPVTRKILLPVLKIMYMI